MAVGFETIKEQILVVLYDYMLTSDSEDFWYSATQIREGLTDGISGAFFVRALRSLTDGDEVEVGIGDPVGEQPDSPIYALTEEGIQSAENILIKKGWSLDDYQPAPSVDRIISRLEEPELHAEIRQKLSDLSAAIAESNEAGDILGDEKDLIDDELNAAKEMSSKERFRLKRLTAFILPTLQFVASKFFGSAIGEAAKNLANLLFKIT